MSTNPITPVIEKSLIAAIAAAEPNLRTGAAFVSVDARILVTLVAIADAARTTLRLSDPEDDLFVDSGADCLQYLAENAAPLLGMDLA